MSQIGRDAASSAPSASASSSTIGMFSFSLMPRPTDTMISAAVRSTARADSRNGSSGLARIAPAVSSGVKFSTGAEPASTLIRAKCARLNGSEIRRGAAGLHIHVHLALKKLAHKNRRRPIPRECRPRR